MSADRHSAVLREDLKSRENVFVLYLTQALLGLVSSNLRAVAAEVRPPRAVVHFVFEQLRPDDAEDVEDILGDLDALLGNEDALDVDEISSMVHVGQPGADWPGAAFRRVYEAKPR